MAKRVREKESGKTKSKTGKTLKQRLKEQKEELKRRSSGSNIFRQKDEGTLRVRILPVGEGNDFAREITQFWLGDTIKGVISPETFNESCAIYDKYNELKNSKDDVDLEIAKKIVPRRKFVIPVLVYTDDKGKKVNTDDTGKLLQITNGLYQEIIDLYLDEDDWGDMTDPSKGYDLKITREGKGKTDTSYSVMPCKNSPLPKEFRKDISLDELIREEVDTYEQTEEKLGQFLGTAFTDEDEEEEETPRRKKKKSSKSSDKTSSKKKKSRRKKDI